MVERRGWDSNPRTSCPVSGFQDRPIRPLSHPAAPVSVLAGGCGCSVHPLQCAASSAAMSAASVTRRSSTSDGDGVVPFARCVRPGADRGADRHGLRRDAETELDRAEEFEYALLNRSKKHSSEEAALERAEAERLGARRDDRPGTLFSLGVSEHRSQTRPIGRGARAREYGEPHHLSRRTGVASRHVHDTADSGPRRPRRGGGSRRPLRDVRARPRLRRRGLDGCARPHGRHRRPRALPRDLLGARYPDRFGLGSGPRGRPRRPLHLAPLRGHDRLRRVGAPPPPGRVRGCTDNSRGLDGACARRLPHVPRCSATPRRARLHGHGHEERRRQPELRTCSGRCTTRSRRFPASTSATR